MHSAGVLSWLKRIVMRSKMVIMWDGDHVRSAISVVWLQLIFTFNPSLPQSTSSNPFRKPKWISPAYTTAFLLPSSKNSKMQTMTKAEKEWLTTRRMQSGKAKIFWRMQKTFQKILKLFVFYFILGVFWFMPKASGYNWFHQTTHQEGTSPPGWEAQTKEGQAGLYHPRRHKTQLQISGRWGDSI